PITGGGPGAPANENPPGLGGRGAKLGGIANCPGGSSTARILHSFILLHLPLMMIFLPNNHGYPPVLPMYLFIAVFPGRLLASLARRLARQYQRHRRQGGYVEQRVQRAGAPSGHEELA